MRLRRPSPKKPKGPWWATLALWFGLLPTALGADPSAMFPSRVFAEAENSWQRASAWLAAELRAIDEPSLLAHSLVSQEVRARFSWFQSLPGRRAVFSLRADGAGRGGTLTMKLAARNDAGALTVYRTATKSLTPEEIAELTREFHLNEFTDLLPFVPTTSADGSAWLLEASLDRFYQLVVRMNPQEAVVQRMGRRFLQHFPDPDLAPVD